MARHKCACSKWTLALMLILVCPYTYSRPQETVSSVIVTSSSPSVNVPTTEKPTRYRHRIPNLRSSFTPLVISFDIDVDNTRDVSKNNTRAVVDDDRGPKNSRVGRLLRRKSNKSKEKKNGVQTTTNDRNHSPQLSKHRNKIKVSEELKSSEVFMGSSEKRKPTIKKVITKWRDKAKLEDIHFSHNNKLEKVKDTVEFHTELTSDDYSSTENDLDLSTERNKVYSSFKPNKMYNKINYNYQPQYDEETYVHSNHVHLIDTYPFPTARPAFIYTTPHPTPIITNLGNPQLWPPPQHTNYQVSYKRPTTTKRPVKITKPNKNNYNYHNAVTNDYPNYPHNHFEVTTFQPTSAYTEKIVIRPEEYSASHDCPTIYLTLNNTFQGEGKEACPDLNINVNTNVVNKNSVVESEEGDDPSGLFPDVFGLPTGEDSDAEEIAANDYSQSDENQELGESESTEGQELLNYNAANGIESDSAEPISAGSSPSAAVSRPGRPNKDDDFGLSFLTQLFRPAINILGWFAAVNPFNFGILPLLLAPIVFLYSGTSSILALFSPGVFPYARESPKDQVQVYRPEWQWDDEIKTWNSNSFPVDRNWAYRIPRNSKEVEEKGKERVNSVRSTWFYKLKKFMRDATENLKILNRDKLEGKLRTEQRRKRNVPEKSEVEVKTSDNDVPAAIAASDVSRRVKTKGPVLGESIKMVATQLLENHANKSASSPIVPDTRIPPKLKSHLDHKHKIKTRNEDGNEPAENTHIGIAVPVTMEDLEKENKLDDISESSTSNEGISTWILLSNPTNKENAPSSTEPTKVEEPQKKQKPTSTKNKNKRPQNKISAKRPIIGSTNKSDLVAGGSAINENILNKLKDTVLTNVQKNKNTPPPTTVATTTTTVAPTTDTPATKREVVTKATPVLPVVKVTSKPAKKKNKNKNKVTTTAAPIENESAYLPMEAKEQEIELEISTPATTTKKPKRSSTKKKNKTKKRKTTKPKEEDETKVADIKTSNKTKSAKPSKKPVTDISTGPFTTQIYNYLSREVMPSAVGVGVIGLASLVGLASYFFYPFATPVRRTLEVDKKDDLYRHNAEEYASEGNGQAEEEMLGTVLAGMPAHSRHKLNPYAGQTTAAVNRYPVKKEQDLRYRHVANKYEPISNYNVHFPQQKTGIAHAAVYSEPVNYNQQQYEPKHTHTIESKYTFDKASSAYTPYPAVEPIYAVPQTAPSGMSSFDSDSSNSVVYGVKPSADTDFKPVYHYDGQFYSDTTNSPATYPPTSMYLGSNDDSDKQPDMTFVENENEKKDVIDAKFVVGNIPKEISDSATPAVVPEHGPRKLNRRKRYALLNKRSIVGSIEEIIKAAKENNKDDIFISNEIDDLHGITSKKLPPMKEELKSEVVTEAKEIFPVYAVSVEPDLSDKATSTDAPTTIRTDIIESVSTIPVDSQRGEKTTATDMSNELEDATMGFKVYEVFTTSDPLKESEQTSPVQDVSSKIESTTQTRNANTETTTESKSEITSTLAPPSPVMETKAPTSKPDTQKPKPTYYPEVITYPPLNQEGSFFTFLKRLVEFKYRLGLSILQSTSESLNRYLRNIERSNQS